MKIDIVINGSIPSGSIHGNRYIGIYRNGELIKENYYKNINLEYFSDIFSNNTNCKYWYLKNEWGELTRGKNEWEEIKKEKRERGETNDTSFPLNFKHITKHLKNYKEESKDKLTRFEMMDI